MLTSVEKVNFSPLSYKTLHEHLAAFRSFIMSSFTFGFYFYLQRIKTYVSMCCRCFFFHIFIQILGNETNLTVNCMFSY